MHAVRFEGPGVLVERDIATPQLRSGEVLIEVRAAGICHSDAHYRAGSPAPKLVPVTLGHEIAGVVADVGASVARSRIGERVAVHYVVTCGTCVRCQADREQFCAGYEMIGNTRDGGFAEYVRVPDPNAIAVPDGVPDAQAAIMMCSTATALHALRRGRLQPGETVAIFGVGGLGQSAVRLAVALGAGRVIAVDRDPVRLTAAASAGATPLDADDESGIAAVSGSVDVAVEMVGSIAVFAATVGVLGKGGRAVAVGLSRGSVKVEPYDGLVRGEIELIGSNDHSRSEAIEVLDLAATHRLDLSAVVTETVDLSARSINAAMNRLDAFGPGMRSVVIPG